MKKQYETISYDKDLLNGHIVAKKKIKEDNGIKGKVTVSLFDAKNGEKIRESYTENLIPDIYFKDTFMRQFINGVMGFGMTRACTNYEWFNYLCLTDSDKPEHVNEQRVMGNIIGYAHRNNTYSGSSTVRGTINKSETNVEVTDTKIKMNYVFDFPTHAANGKIESVYFTESDVYDKDYFYLGAPILAREGGDGYQHIYSNTNPKRYFAARYGFESTLATRFTASTKGFMIIDGKSPTFSNSTQIKFPDNLKGHWVYVPFEVMKYEMFIWEEAIRLLNKDGEPLAAIASDTIKQNDGLSDVCIHHMSESDYNFIGYYNYTISNESYIRIYRWTKVGVLISYIDINTTQTFKDLDYNSVFKRTATSTHSVYNDGTITLIGYNARTDSQYNETNYTSRLIKINTEGQVIQDMNLKPKIGNSSWFSAQGMDSGNIERRCYVQSISITKSRLYLFYQGVQSGQSFYQCITHSGNLLEPYRKYLAAKDFYYTGYNILGRDEWMVKFGEKSYDYHIEFNLFHSLTSRPIGTHTRLAQPVEKTEVNTMKVQYLFEIDLVPYGEDYY